MKERKLKRAFDILLAVICIVIFMPLFIAVAVAILLESLILPATKGPVLNPEHRISKGRTFNILKFRVIKGSLLGQVRKHPDSKTQSIIQHRHGALTPVGKFIAKFYLDEFPQFFNILIGQMSFVGPRPQLPDVYKKEHAKFAALKYISGGLCGLRQACKRDVKMHKNLLDKHRKICGHHGVVYLDDIYLHYYKTLPAWKLFLYDLQIVFLTLRTTLQGEGTKKHLLDGDIKG